MQAGSGGEIWGKGEENCPLRRYERSFVYTKPKHIMNYHNLKRQDPAHSILMTIIIILTIIKLRTLREKI
jgi:hypothetical protein